MDEKFLNEDSNNSSLDSSDDTQNLSESIDAVEGELEQTADDTTLTEEDCCQENMIEEPDSAEVPKVEPSAYAFRWDYASQANYDRQMYVKGTKNRGVATYVIILIVTFMLSVSAVIASVIIGNSMQQSAPQFKEHIPMKYDDALALDELYQVCLPSYVAISVNTGSGEGTGSGIIITEDGYICTNYHVVEGHKKITVITYDKKEYTAEYIDGDETNDIAVIKINAQNLPKAVLGKSSETRIGERVMAIGTPFSKNYAGSMTVGYVSGVDRLYSVKNDNGTVKKTLKLLQTDTSVNPGNSGGPLYNMNGEVIGVVTLKIAGSSYEGMGFALPIDGVRNMIFDIIENGKITDENAGSAVKGAALGISGHAVKEDQKYLMTSQYCIEVQSDDEGDFIEWSSTGLFMEKVYVTDTETLNALGLEGAYPYHAPATGVLVKTTSEGFDAAEKLQIEDVIISANGVSCGEMSTLQEIIFNSRAGDILELEVFRNGEIINVSVELGYSNSME